MPKISWNSKDFKDPQDSSGTSTENISGGGLKQGYKHGSLTEGLKSYYSFESSSGSTLVERTVLGEDGDIRGASWTGDSFTGDYALSFDGNGDDVKITSPALLESSGSLSLKFKLRSRKDNYTYFFSHPDASNANRVYLLTEHNSENNVLSTGLGDSFPIRTEFTPELDTWYAVTLIWENGDYRIFLDGEKISEGTYSGTIQASTDWFIGSQNGERQYQDAVIDDLRIHERSLTTPEIEALHSQNTTSKVSPGDTL